MAKDLGVEVVRLKRRVVNMWRLGPLKEEEAVVIHQLITSVKPEEDSDVDVLVIVDKLKRQDVSVKREPAIWWEA